MKQNKTGNIGYPQLPDNVILDRGFFNCIHRFEEFTTYKLLSSDGDEYKILPQLVTCCAKSNPNYIDLTCTEDNEECEGYDEENILLILQKRYQNEHT